MPVILNTNPSDCSRENIGALRSSRSTACVERACRNLTIGLVNNMPDSALEATERQFISLLGSASEGMTVHLYLYSLPGVPRRGASASRVSDFYSSTENLPRTQLDGLIVTGTEPLSSNLADEPYWGSFMSVLDWAQNGTYSAVWSCLAAHAAVLYQDDIRRIRSERKNFGIFDCHCVAKHALTEGIQSHFKLPHSRWNGLSADELMNHGYRVLSRTEDGGVDIFVQQKKSLFVFLQGHPEYESKSLLLEYQRDLGRFSRGEMVKCPAPPRGYFDADSHARLIELQEEGATGPRQGLRDKIIKVLESATLKSTWRDTATRIYGNWLHYISVRKRSELRAAGDKQEEAALGAIGPFVNETEISVPPGTGQLVL
ncbi:MAG: homoserine O-succinyltransferase [Terracidiphilus sp.]